MKYLLSILCLFIFSCDDDSDLRIDVDISYDQFYQFMIPGGNFYGETEIVCFVHNTGNVNIVDYSITIECINSQSQTRTREIEGSELGVGEFNIENTTLTIIDPQSPIQNCYLKSQILDGITTDF